MEFDLGLGFLKKIFLFWVLGYIHKCTEMGLCVWSLCMFYTGWWVCLRWLWGTRVYVCSKLLVFVRKCVWWSWYKLWEEAGAFFWVSLFYLFISDIVGGFLCFDGEFEFFWKIHMKMEWKKVRNERGVKWRNESEGRKRRDNAGRQLPFWPNTVNGSHHFVQNFEL